LPEREEPPPIFGSWRALYTLVVVCLLVMIAVCAAITRWGTR
jgi:hypothetical protein